jgi:FkbM family methyltransferase
VLSVTRHDVTMRFADEGYTETPYVLKPMLEGKVYEEDYLQRIRDLGRAGVYVDVGAHLGTHTVWFAMQCPSTHVHAFEPVARFARAVRTNVELNGLSGQVTVHEVGLAGSRHGEASNHLSREHAVGMSTDEPVAFDVLFPTARLDDLVRDRVAVIKLDVEGMEPQVLAGARRILDRDRPEVFAEAFTAVEREALDRALRPYGYRNAGKVSGTGQPVFRFTAPPRVGVERLRGVWRRIPAPVRGAAWRLRHRPARGQRTAPPAP